MNFARIWQQSKTIFVNNNYLKSSLEILRDPQDEIEVIERYILLLLGVVDRHIPSIISKNIMKDLIHKK